MCEFLNKEGVVVKLGRLRYVLFTTLGLVAAASLIFSLSQVSKRDAVNLIHTGVLPDQDAETLRQIYAPLLEYLERETDLDFYLVIPATYADLLRQFANKDVELAYFGGLTFVNAQANHGARPLVMRDVDTRFTSYFVIKADGPLRQCEDMSCEALAGKVFSFASRLSTSGHLMPRHFLSKEKAIIPEQFFGEVRYSGAHDKTLYELRGGEIDAGAVNSEIFRSMLLKGDIKPGEFRIIWETPPYPDYVWATARGMAEERRTKIRNAFLSLDINDEDHRDILRRMGAEYFLPAGSEDFAPLRAVAASLGLLEPQK